MAETDMYDNTNSSNKLTLNTGDPPQGQPMPSGKGALLASGRGADNRLSPQFYMILLVAVVLPLGLGYFLATQFGYQQVGLIGPMGGYGFVRTVFFFVYIVIGVVLAVAVVCAILLDAGQLRKTEIFVYKDKIEGVGVEPKFAFFAGGLKPFSLPLEGAALREDAAVWMSHRVTVVTDAGTLHVYLPNTAEVIAAAQARS